MTAKKKNTLKDLDAFLKQEASSLVSPEKVEKKTVEEGTSASAEENESSAASMVTEPSDRMGRKSETVQKPTKPDELEEELSETPIETTQEIIVKALLRLHEETGDKFREELYKLLKTTLEQLPESTAADKMMINTVLFLRHREDWEEVIRSYWENHPQ